MNRFCSKCGREEYYDYVSKHDHNMEQGRRSFTLIEGSLICYDCWSGNIRREIK